MNKELWLKAAAEKGFESFEIYQAFHAEKTYSWFDGQLDSFVTSSVTGNALRGIYNKKMVGFSTEKDDDAAVAEVLDAMAQQAGAITSDDETVIFPPFEDAPEPALSSRKWVKPDAAQVKELLSQIEKKILAYDPAIRQVSFLQWTEQTDSRQITNSLGMRAEDTGYAQVLAAGAAAVREGEVKDSYLEEVIEDLAGFDADRFVKKLCDDTLAKLGAKSVPSGQYRVIFKNEAMTSLFAAFSDIFSGERIGKGISPLAGKVGEAVFSEVINVVDDPRCDKTVRLMNYDDEGHPTAKKTVVDRGVFTTVLHSSRSAARMNTKSTGNGFKSSCASAVDVRPMNCCILPGAKTLEEMCGEMGDGIVITALAGLHAGLDHVTGDFSLQCSGYLVKDGRRDRSVTLITVAGNYLDMMKRAVCAGNDLDWKYYTIACPSVAFAGCAISGE